MAEVRFVQGSDLKTVAGSSVPATFFDAQVPTTVTDVSTIMERMTVSELKALCRYKGQKEYGSKADIIERLIEATCTEADIRTGGCSWMHTATAWRTSLSVMWSSCWILETGR